MHSDNPECSECTHDVLPGSGGCGLLPSIAGNGLQRRFTRCADDCADKAECYHTTDRFQAETLPVPIRRRRGEGGLGGQSGGSEVGAGRKKRAGVEAAELYNLFKAVPRWGDMGREWV